MTGRRLYLERRTLVIVITLALVNALGAMVGASTLGRPRSEEPPTARPTLTGIPAYTSTQTPTPTLTPTPMPDLVVVSMATDPSPLLKDQPGTVRVEVKNKGPGRTTTNCWVGLYIDRAPVGEPTQQMFCPPLDVDQSSTVAYTVILRDVGYHAFTAWVDFLELIPEKDETNNQYSASILVAEPTPTPSSTSTPLPTPTPSATLTPSPTLAPSSTSTPLPTPTPRPGEPSNLVYNGGFEGTFISHGGLGEVADGWTPFVETQGVPQFLRGKEQAKGQNSQRIWSDYVPFRAGITQRVVGISAGQTYIARAEMLSIFGEGDTPVQGMNIGKQIGLDPRGGDDPSSPNVIWSDVNWVDRAWQEGEGALWVSATAEAGVITLFIRVNNVYGGRHDLCYVDEVTLHSFEPTPTSTPSSTSTATATPTSTPLPSATVTSPPLQVLTPSATLLPLGTATSTSAPTLIPEAEGEPLSTRAPTPTVSPAARSVRRFIPLFFVLGLVTIVILIGAILWLQEPGRLGG